MKRIKTIWPSVRNLGLAAGAVLLAAAPAVAQQDARTTGQDKGILQWVVALGIIILAAAIAFMNPKRSHQD